LEFNQIHTIDAFGDEDEVIRFSGQKFKGRGHGESIMWSDN